ncbi:hypothetical protein LH128_09026 [Sphingomonas sp. LH128]|jgi:hypothetical protein|uniref:hypothetical protein n=1 Tax=Sphingomonadaceae TaxID=41297 RepID=UPI00027CA711|nr:MULTISPECIES: hypothetical protein [Sphingomonadaceae]EJU13386.1 hypothetical protein LH128_09026 [Sphingomonas sp. LH128]
MTDRRIAIDAADGSMAALFSIASLAQVLMAKGALAPSQIDLAFASAASSCRAIGIDGGSQLIELLFPTVASPILGGLTGATAADMRQ